jgi:hypothetical protein
MKYTQLTKEQFLSLYEEFSRFLATQQIDVKEWEKIKVQQPKVAEEELNIFSDLVWEGALSKAQYLEHISNQHCNLFKCNSKEIIRIYIQLKDSSRSFLNPEDFNWFKQNPLDDSFEYFKAVKKYSKERNVEMFELIKKGSQISEGELFNAISQLIQ